MDYVIVELYDDKGACIHTIRHTDDPMDALVHLGMHCKRDNAMRFNCASCYLNGKEIWFLEVKS